VFQQQKVTWKDTILNILNIIDFDGKLQNSYYDAKHHLIKSRKCDLTDNFLGPLMMA